MIQDQRPQSIFEDEYYDKIHRITWIRRTAGAMAGATMGAGYGIGLGVVASFMPYLAGAMGIGAAVAVPEIAVIASTAAIFAGAVALLGIAISSDVSANSAAVSAWLEETQAREHLKKPEEKSPVRDDSNCVLSPKKESFFNWKVAVVAMPLFATFGALIALHPTGSAMLSNLLGGVVMTPAASAMASAVIFGMGGILIGAKNSVISNKLCNFYTRIISGRYFEQSCSKETMPQAGQLMEKSQTNDMSVAHEPEIKKKSFAIEKTSFSFQEMIGKTEEQPVLPLRG